MLEPLPFPADTSNDQGANLQSYLFIGGHQFGINIPLATDLDAIEMPAGVAGKETCIRDTLTLGDVFITIYRHESLTSEQVLNHLVEYYKAWVVNRPGSPR